MAKYVDLKKAIEAIDDLPNCYNGYSDTYDKAYIIGTLEEVPTADVRENVHAHWEDWSFLGFDMERHWFRRCSNCLCEREDDNEDKDTPFCPNCGAVMDERRDDE